MRFQALLLSLVLMITLTAAVSSASAKSRSKKADKLSESQEYPETYGFPV